MAKRQTIGDNPLDAYISPIITTNGHPAQSIENVSANSQKRTKKEKQRITVQISVEVIERIKNAVYWTPGLTLASLAEDAFSKAVNQIEKEKGKPFPHRKEELKTGRPLS